MVNLMLPEHLSTERLFLQRLRYEDAEEIFYTYASKPLATRFVSWPTHEKVADTNAFLTYANHAWTSTRCVANPRRAGLVVRPGTEFWT